VGKKFKEKERNGMSRIKRQGGQDQTPKEMNCGPNKQNAQKPENGEK